MLTRRMSRRISFGGVEYELDSKRKTFYVGKEQRPVDGFRCCFVRPMAPWSDPGRVASRSTLLSGDENTFRSRSPRQPKSGSTHPRIGQQSALSNFRATVNSFRSCLKVIDTFRRRALSRV